MGGERDLTVRILGDASGARQALGQVDDATDKTKGHFGAMSAAVTAGAVAGGVALVKFGKDAVDAFAESRKVSAQTEAAIKSTGGAAGVTAGHVGDLAHRLQGLSGVEDEAIQTGQNMLLTFTNVQNRVGKGNDVFDQASKVMLDMSVAMGGDTQQAALQLGKALNDPVKGVGALSRVGVTFTAQQKEQIKAMVKAGDAAGAQKVILAELNKEFGGSAKAAGDALTPMERLKLRFGDIQETVGSLLLPVLEKLSGVAVSLGEGFVRLAAPLGQVVQPVIAELSGGLRAMFAAFKAGDGDVTSSGLPGAMERIGNAARSVVDWFVEHWPDIKQAASGVVEWVRANVVPIFAQVVEWVRANWPQIAEAVAHVANAVRIAFEALAAFMRPLWDNIRGIVEGAIRAIGAVISLVLAVVNGDWGRAWESIKGIVSGAWEVIRNVIGAGVDVIVTLLRPVGNFLHTWVVQPFDAVVGWVAGLPARIASAAHGMWDGIKDAFRSAINWIIRGWNGIQFTIPGFKIGPVGYSGFTLGVPDIPLLAQGGIVKATPGGTLALIGEAGRDEAVIPLPSGGGMAGGVHIDKIEINAPNYVGDRPELARVIMEEFRRYFQRGGNLGFS